MEKKWSRFFGPKKWVREKKSGYVELAAERAADNPHTQMPKNYQQHAVGPPFHRFSTQRACVRVCV